MTKNKDCRKFVIEKMHKAYLVSQSSLSITIIQIVLKIYIKRVVLVRKIKWTRGVVKSLIITFPVLEIQYKYGRKFY